MKEPDDGCMVDRLEDVEGRPEFVSALVVPRLKRILSARLGPGLVGQLKRLSAFASWLAGSRENGSLPAPRSIGQGLEAGEVVRIRTAGEIEATLDHRRRLRGLRFMPEMEAYCGTTQRVFGRVERFFDERERTVKRSKGIVLLEGLVCRGASKVGRCDRACLFFWREEWLERVPAEAQRVDPHGGGA